MQKIRIGIIGNGNFTKFIAPILEKYFEIFIFSRSGTFLFNHPQHLLENEGSIMRDLDYLIFSIPLFGIEEMCKKIQDKVSEKTIIVDVTSVKVEPLRILKQYFLNNQILGTHPIFGPQSGKNGIENLPIVLTNVSVEENKYLEIKNFLSEVLKLKVIEKTAGQHDREMAYVQGLSHFIGRALAAMEIQDYDTATQSYKQLVNLEYLVGNDSWDLYKTIQNGNELTKDVRAEFLKTLQNLEEKLESGE
jgi:prephenate dehydrogenase